MPLTTMVQQKKKQDTYIEAVGRRKTARARVRLFLKKGETVINNKEYHAYFPTNELQTIIDEPLVLMHQKENMRAEVHVLGGGIHSQAEAVRHGIARSLVKFDPTFRQRLKKAHFLTRDPRMKERRKFGLKKARRAPQWQKR